MELVHGASITVNRARRSITMDASCPSATHVVVRDGRLLAVCGARHVGRQD
jgi:predicted amidohydrolase YtcJ